MMRKKAVQNLDSRQLTLIENAFFYCNPPEKQKVFVTSCTLGYTVPNTSVLQVLLDRRCTCNILSETLSSGYQHEILFHFSLNFRCIQTVCPHM